MSCARSRRRNRICGRLIMSVCVASWRRWRVLDAWPAGGGGRGRPGAGGGGGGGGGGGTHPGFGYPLQNGPRELWLSMWSRLEKGGRSDSRTLHEKEGSKREPTLWGQSFSACVLQGKHPALAIICVLITVLRVIVSE